MPLLEVGERRPRDGRARHPLHPCPPSPVRAQHTGFPGIAPRLTLGRVEPAWEPWKPDADGPRLARLRGGYRWRVTLPAGARKTLRAAYEIKISGKAELVGGNRRET